MEPQPISVISKSLIESGISWLTFREGTYGIVYRAKHKSSGDIVALKRIRMELSANEGLPISSLREISLLKTLSHENIINVLDVVVGDSIEDIFLLMEYCEQVFASLIKDMANLMDTVLAKNEKTRVFKVQHVKCLLEQLLRGVKYLHSRYIIHRDLKLSNLLLTGSGILKIADFGLARKFGDPIGPLTPKVVTLWYRSPELLLGVHVYTEAIDMWAVGCIFGELLLSRPLLPAKNEAEQMQMICHLLGSPRTAIWPELKSMPLYREFKFPDSPYDTVSDAFAQFSKTTQDLVKGFLVYRPDRRETARGALEHDFFYEPPRACLPLMLPTFPELRNEAFENILSKRKFDEEEIMDTVDGSDWAPPINKYGI